MTAATDTATGEAAFTRPYRAWLLVVLLLVNAINLADRQGIVPW